MNKVWCGTGHGCPTCNALNYQVHAAETWDNAGLYPGCKLLICGDKCQCNLIETEEPVSGSLTSIPTKEKPMPIEEIESNMPRIMLQADYTPHGFEIKAITPGAANGWMFIAGVLERSAPLWEGVECFLHHDKAPDPNSPRDVQRLAGYLSEPFWNSSDGGFVQAKLVTAGPSGPALAAMGKQILEGAPIKVGFSGDIYLRHENRVVTEITKVNFCDCVHNPARGGVFVRALFQQGDLPMEPTTLPQVVGGNEASITTTLAPVAPPDSAAVSALLQERVNAQVADSVRQARAQMCEYLLDAGLNASRLPEAARKHVRAHFQSKGVDGKVATRVFEPTELQDEIEMMRETLSEQQLPGLIQGAGAVRSMFTAEDQLQAAVYDLFQTKRPVEMAQLQTAKLTGIRELYVGLTGDSDFYGGLDLVRAQFQHTTANFTGLVKNAMNKILVEHWALLGQAGYDWWQDVIYKEHFNDPNEITWNIFGTIASLPAVAEGGEYTELQIGDGSETSTFQKYGGYVGVTLEAIMRDDARKLRQLPRELATAGIRGVSSLVAAIFTANAGVGPTMADTGALFNATAVTTAGGHANLLTTALSAGEWDVVGTAMYNQPMLVRNATGYYGTGKKMALNPRYLLVPRKLQLTAEGILYPSQDRTVQVNSENLQRGQRGDVKVVPEWTDVTDWAAVADPNIMPGICLGEINGLMPEIFVAGDQQSPAVFMNDESRIKVRHWLAVGVADPRPLHKSNVAG